MQHIREVPMQNQRYTNPCYQNQMYQPVISEPMPNPTLENIFNMTCLTQYETFTKRELSPILVYIYDSRNIQSQEILKNLIIPCLIDTLTRVLVVDVQRVPLITYIYRHIINTLPVLLWTFRGQPLRKFTHFAKPKRFVTFVTGANSWRNKGMYQTTS